MKIYNLFFLVLLLSCNCSNGNLNRNVKGTNMNKGGYVNHLNAGNKQLLLGYILALKENEVLSISDYDSLDEIYTDYDYEKLFSVCTELSLSSNTGIKIETWCNIYNFLMSAIFLSDKKDLFFEQLFMIDDGLEQILKKYNNGSLNIDSLSYSQSILLQTELLRYLSKLDEKDRQYTLNNLLDNIW